MERTKKRVSKGILIPCACLAFTSLVGMLVVLFGVHEALYATLFRDVLCIAVLGVVIWKVYPKLQSASIARSNRVTLVCLLIVSAVAMWVASQVLGTYFLYAIGDSAFDTYESNLTVNIPVMLVLSCVIAPIYEELLFRGVLFRGLCDYFKHPIVAVVLSSLVFCWVHGTLVHVPATFGLGVFSCALYMVTRSLWSSILLHMASNSVSYLFGSVMVPVEVISSPVWGLLWAVMVAVAVWTVVCLSRAEKVPTEEITPSENN